MVSTLQSELCPLTQFAPSRRHTLMLEVFYYVRTVGPLLRAELPRGVKSLVHVSYSYRSMFLNTVRYSRRVPYSTV